MLLHFLFIIIFVPTSMGFWNPYKETPEEKAFQRITNPKIGPKGMPYNKTTSCDKFGKYARFNPDSVVGSAWFVFYYWATPQPTTLYEFWIPSKKDMQFLHYTLDGHLPPAFNVTATLVLMRNLANNSTFLLETKGDRGQYRSYYVERDIPEGKITDFKDIRIKQTGDNKYVAVMHCKTRTALVMARFRDIPTQSKIQDEVSRIGIRSRKGKSYLYQGHEWMPLPEMDEGEFWKTNKKIKDKFGDKKF